MKKTKLSISIISIFLSCTLITIKAYSQQQIPNGDFENWTGNGSYEDPDEWSTLNYLYVYGAPVTAVKVNDAASGNFALELTSYRFGGASIPGLALSGDIFGAVGFPFTDRPVRFQFSYKAFPQKNDSCFIVAGLTHWDSLKNQRDSLAYAFMAFGDSVTEFTMADIPFEYSNTSLAPDSLFIFLASSADSTGLQDGNRFIVDNLRFSYEPMNVPATSKERLNIYPNPASEKLMVGKTDEVVQARLFNQYGQLIRVQTIEVNGDLDISDLPGGIYYLQLTGYLTNTYYGIHQFVKR